MKFAAILGAVSLFLTGCGAETNPPPPGSLVVGKTAGAEYVITVKAKGNGPKFHYRVTQAEWERATLGTRWDGPPQP